MALRDLLNKAFRKPTEPPQRRQDDKANVAKREQLENERKTAAAIDAKQAELHRSNLTPELTIAGTQPKPALSDEQARDGAEKSVAAKALKEAQDTDRADNEAKKDPPEKTSQADREADSPEAGAATAADIAEVEKWTVVHNLEADKQAAATAWTPESEAALIIAEREARQARDAQSLSHETDTGRDRPG